VLVVFLTSGDANKWSKYVITWNPFPRAEDYRALGVRREKEALRSLAILGVHQEQAIFLRYPDGGLRTLWSTDWSEARPYCSPFTHRSAPPAELAFTSGTAYCGQDLLEDLVKIILAFRPTIVYLPDLGDAHPDHQAASLFGQAAVSQAEGDDPLLVPPDMRAYLVHANEKDWPSPERLSPGLAFDTSALREEGAPWQAVPLSPSTEKLKLRAVRAHLSQAWFKGGRFLVSFVRSDEIYQPLNQTNGGLSPATNSPPAGLPPAPTALGAGDQSALTPH
jgi:LmbE family N-acetylglucosaminyl deacetylase